MKDLKLIPLLLLFSCSKQVQPIEQPQPVRMGGLIADDPKKVEKVPLIVSKGFIQVVLKGKPVNNISFISPMNGAVVSGTVLIKTSVTSTIYIDGVQVNQTGSYSWNTINAVKGMHTITAQVKGTKISIVVFIETIIIDPVDTIVKPPTDTIVTPPVTGKIVMPPVSNQGSEGSCVAFAVGYAARSFEQYNRTGATSYNIATNVFSPEHLFNNIKFGETCDVGTAMQTALEFIMLNGILPLSEMPYTSGTCQPTETELQKQIALQYKIEGYYKIYTTDRAAIRSMIDQKNPVIISLACDQSFLDAKAGFVWRQYSGSGYLPHCVVICGYDDVKNAWLIMNSWGTSWGDAGYSWIGYELFPTRTGTWCYAIK
jgi:hypothetical protein